MKTQRLGRLALTFLALALGHAVADEPMRLPSTQPLMLEGDLSAQMHEAAHRDMERVIAESVKTRAQFWQRDVSSPEAYGRSIEPGVDSSAGLHDGAARHWIRGAENSGGGGLVREAAHGRPVVGGGEDWCGGLRRRRAARAVRGDARRDVINVAGR